MLVDANILLYAVDRASPSHAKAKEWLTGRLAGPRRLALPWLSLSAFLRIITNPRAARNALPPAQAWERVSDWLAAEVTWIPEPGARYADILGGLIRRYEIRGNLVTDAQLAALALEHGLTVCSADTDFARFSDLRWENPLAA